jgi:hypothetical protein
LDRGRFRFGPEVFRYIEGLRDMLLNHEGAEVTINQALARPVSIGPLI